MREDYEETKVVKHFKITCDFCPILPKTSIDSYNGFGTCAICGKHGCYKCGEFFYEGGSDHASHYGCREHAPLIRKAYNERDDFENTVPDIDYFINKKKEQL